MPIRKLKQFLDGHDIHYVVITHSPAYTAQKIAASAHIPGKEMAKTVMIKVDDEMAMAVLPASKRVDFEFLKALAGADRVELAGEDEFKSLFPESDTGAMPPFGNLYGMEVYVAEALAEDEEIAFNAGSHTELVQMMYNDFRRLVDPKIGKFAV